MIKCPKCKSIKTFTILARMDKEGFYHKLGCERCRHEFVTDKVN